MVSLSTRFLAEFRPIRIHSRPSHPFTLTCYARQYICCHECPLFLSRSRPCSLQSPDLLSGFVKHFLSIFIKPFLIDLLNLFTVIPRANCQACILFMLISSLNYWITNQLRALHVRGDDGEFSFKLRSYSMYRSACSLHWLRMRTERITESEFSWY